MPNQESNQSVKSGSGFFYGYVIVAIVFIFQILMYGSRTSYGIYFKPMLSDFDWTRALTSSAFSISIILQGLAGIVMGGLNDRLGPRVVMTLTGLLSGLGFMLMSQVYSIWQLYLFYVVILGIGMGGLLAPQLSTIVRWFVKRRSMMTGIAIAGGGVGGIISPPIINWLIASYGWRDAYLIMGGTVLVVVTLGAQFLKRDPTQMGQRPYGEDEDRKLEVSFIAEGLSFKDATRTRQLWMLVALSSCFGFSLMTVMIHLVPHITDLGISAATASNVLATTGGAVLAGGILMGLTGDRIGIRRVYSMSFALMAVALFTLLLARDVWSFYLAAVIVGLANGGATATSSPLIADLFGVKSHGMILGVHSFCFTLGAAVGPSIAGYIFDSSGSYQTAFLICALTATAGVILAIMLRPIKK
jgi:MFS family permease